MLYYTLYLVVWKLTSPFSGRGRVAVRILWRGDVFDLILQPGHCIGSVLSIGAQGPIAACYNAHPHMFWPPRHRVRNHSTYLRDDSGSDNCVSESLLFKDVPSMIESLAPLKP